jgi:hypothetical protein
MASVLHAGSQLASGSVRFVTRRTALSLAVSVACVSAGLALAAGVAIGMHWPARDAPGHQDRAQARMANGLERKSNRASRV